MLTSMEQFIDLLVENYDVLLLEEDGLPCREIYCDDCKIHNECGGGPRIYEDDGGYRMARLTAKDIVLLKQKYPEFFI